MECFAPEAHAGVNIDEITATMALERGADVVGDIIYTLDERKFGESGNEKHTAEFLAGNIRAVLITRSTGLLRSPPSTPDPIACIL